MSTSRLEKFIYAICSMEVSDLPAPLSRIEILWNCLITGETPDFEPQSRNEQYLMAMLGLYELNQLPTPMSRGEKLLYKIAMGETDLSDVPGYLSRYEELLKYLIENGGVGDFEYILQTLNQRLSTLYSTKERPMKQAVIKGDTLVNELPRPSLKNTMENVSSQKLNAGYDNGNVVDGEFKSAILKGNTLLFDELGNECEIPNSPKITVGMWINTSTGVDTESVTSFITGFLKCPTVTFIVKGNNKYKRIGFYNKNKKFISGIDKQVTNNSDITIESTKIPSNAFYLKISASIYAEDVSYTPDTKLLIEDMSGNNLYSTQLMSVKMPVLTTTGKNLFDLSTTTDGYEFNKDELVQNSSWFVSDFIKTEPNTAYIFSGKTSGNRVVFYNINKNKIGNKTMSDNKIITIDNCYYIRINGLITEKNTWQVEKGEQATPYEPYKSNTLTLVEPVTLRKVGDMEDEFDALTGQVTERVGEIVLDGSENWYLGTTKELTQVFALEVRDMAFIDNKLNCDKLPVNASGDVEKVTSWYKSNNERYTYCLYMALLKNKTSTVDGLKTYLSQNPITVQYQLKTSTTKTVNTTITDQDNQPQTKLHSFNDGYLSVSSQGLLPSAVNYEVPTNNSYYLPDMLTLGAQYTSRGSADCNATIDGKLLALGKNRTFTTPSSVTDKLMVLDAPVDDLMFIKGDQTAKDFGYFEGMKSVGLSNKMPVLKTTGKNLFDGELELGGLSTTTGLPNNNQVDRCRTKNYTKVKPSTTYVAYNNYSSTIGIREFDDNYNFISWSSLPSSNKFTTSNNTKYLKFIIINTNNDNLLQIEEDSTATSYEPYKTNILRTPSDLELRGIGEVQDTLDLMTGEVVERVGEIVLDGSENIITWGNLGFSMKGTTTSGSATISINNKYQSYGNASVLSKAEGNGIAVNNNNLYIKTNEFTSITEFTDYLQSNPITIQYHLETESIKTVDLTTVDQDGQPTQLKTFNDITYVELSSEGLIPSVDLEVATKINEALSTMGLQQLDISETQDRLGQTIDEQTENTDATMMATTEIYEQTL